MDVLLDRILQRVLREWIGNGEELCKNQVRIKGASSNRPMQYLVQVRRFCESARVESTQKYLDCAGDPRGGLSCGIQQECRWPRGGTLLYWSQAPGIRPEATSKDGESDMMREMLDVHLARPPGRIVDEFAAARGAGTGAAEPKILAHWARTPL